MGGFSGWVLDSDENGDGWGGWVPFCICERCARWALLESLREELVRARSRPSLTAHAQRTTEITLELRRDLDTTTHLLKHQQQPSPSPSPEKEEDTTLELLYGVRYTTQPIHCALASNPRLKALLVLH